MSTKKNLVWPEKQYTDAYNINNINNNTKQTNPNDTLTPIEDIPKQQNAANNLENAQLLHKTNGTTYHLFRYSCGYRANRRCTCLNKFVRMPIWYFL